MSCVRMEDQSLACVPAPPPFSTASVFTQLFPPTVPAGSSDWLVEMSPSEASCLMNILGAVSDIINGLREMSPSSTRSLR